VNKKFLLKFRSLHLVVLFFASVGVSTGCGENIFDQKWTIARVDTVLIYSLARPELNLPSGFDFLNRQLVELQAPGATGAWDLVLDTRDGQLVFLPPGVLQITSAAMVLPLPDMVFGDVIKAPKDTTLYSRDQAVPVSTGTVYVLRTHQGADRFGFPCSFWGKLQPIEVDLAAGAVRFEYDVSTLCDDRGLIPTDE
jgi:hypothetical protein